jgi:gamma-glutamylputrescine oxidase
MSGKYSEAPIFHRDFREEPFWWLAAPPEDTRSEPVPEDAEIVIIGSGFCGLSAAIEVARHGVKTVVVDAGPLGGGASSRSGGMVTAGPKLLLRGLASGKTSKFDDAAVEDAMGTLTFLKGLIARERFDADLQITGRFYGAFSPGHLSAMRREADLLADRGATVRFIEPADQHTEVCSEYFHGGYVVEDYGGVDPGKLNRALRQAARASGASLHSHAAAIRVCRDGRMYEVITARGRIRARRVLFATNGYTDGASPWAQRRVLPVASYLIATEPLPSGTMDELIPKRRMVSDSRKDLLYMRPSPDGRRLIFGCRPRAVDRRPLAMAPYLHARLVRVFPSLESCRITHAWSGFVGMTRDRLPHITEHEGILYALGCNGSGVALMVWLGWHAANVLLNAAHPTPTFAGRVPRRIPLRRLAGCLATLASIAYHARDFASNPTEVLAERLRVPRGRFKRAQPCPRPPR